MNIFFGKISGKYDPNQLIEGYYHAKKDSGWFNGINIGDYAFIMSSKGVQLWKAKEWAFENTEQERLSFEIIFNDLGSIQDFILLKYLKLTVDLIVKTSRSTAAQQKAFFPLETEPTFTEALLTELNAYKNQVNYRKINILSSKDKCVSDSYDIQLYYEAGTLKIAPSKNCDPSVYSKFQDTTSMIGKGQSSKDRTLKEVANKENLDKEVSDKLSLKDLYDAFMCKYKEETDETTYWVVNGYDKERLEYCLNNDLFVMQFQYNVQRNADVSRLLGKAKKIKEGDKVLLFNSNKYYAHGTFVKAEIPGSAEQLLADQITNKKINLKEEIITYSDAPCYFEDLRDTNGFNSDWGERLTIEEWENKNIDGINVPGIADQIEGIITDTIIKLKDSKFYNKIKSVLSDKINNYMEFQKLLETAAVFEEKKQIILQGPPGTGKTYTAKDLAEVLLLGTLTEDKVKQKESIEGTQRFKLVQFHPSYSYEDFVRGIVAKSNGTQIEYVTENKILAKFAKEAKLNYDQSQLAPQLISAKNWYENKLNEFIDTVELAITNNGEYSINNTVFINEIIPGAFKYTGRNAETHLLWTTAPRAMKFEDLIQGCINNVQSRQEFIALNGISGLAKQHATYFYRIIELFRASITEPVPNFAGAQPVELKKYVLVIDEINRANLPSVLGELIYALEYRDQSVNSMYDIDGDYSLVIPSNLYIIGTMNTADRSVGHIDYAIKRRFAFMNVLPNESVIILPKAKTLFNLVSTLFTDVYLASDFEKDDVQLGHSYFIATSEMKLKIKLIYEIMPILKEYIKDGLLKENSKDKLKEIEEFADQLT
jgi:MoxR-like ATPase